MDQGVGFTQSDWMGKFGDWFVPEPNTGCWIWTRGVSSGTTPRTAGGYGKLRKHRRDLLAHRVAYELMVGEIPAGMTVDHACRVRCCVNPEHLRLMTAAENALSGNGVMARNKRKTSCKRGHPLTGINLVLVSRGRRCRECERTRAWES